MNINNINIFHDVITAPIWDKRKNSRLVIPFTKRLFSCNLSGFTLR